MIADPPLFAPEPRESACDRLDCYRPAEYGCARCDRGVCGRCRVCEEHYRIEREGDERDVTVWTLRGRLARSVARHAEAASILAEAERHASTPTERACAACGRACDTIFSGVRVHGACRSAWREDA